MTANAHQAPPERAPDILFCRATVADGSIDETARTVRFIASTEQIDGHGTIVRQNWDLKRFTPRGVVLYAHCADELPIGTATASVEDGKLIADVKFSTKELNEKAEQVWLNVKEGVLRGISPGFLPHTVTFETHDDRNVMVLDDNELIELSITPCPSNAGALAQIRSLHTPSPALETPPPAPAGSAVTATPPSNEEATMAENTTSKTEPVLNSLSILRALDLPVGATEQDGVAAGVRLRQLEVQVVTLTGSPSTAEAMGALRAMKDNADKYMATAAELAVVKGERDLQNFETLILQGRSERKLTPAEEAYERDLFTKACAAGRGSDRIGELRGYLAVKNPIVQFARSVNQPASSAGAGTPLLWNGKAYKDLKPAQRAKLAAEDEALYRAMKDDHEAAGAAA